MSRLFGLYSEEPVKLSCIQAKEIPSWRNLGENSGNPVEADGWGIGFYKNNGSFLFKKASKSSKSQRITNITEVISSPIIVSHVRHATVGERKEANTHPFRWGLWLFAHYGKINHFRRIRSKIMRKLPSAYKKQIEGNTDSEFCFYLYLSHLKKEGAIKKGDIDLDAAIKGLKNFRNDIEEFQREADVTEMSELNFLISNGSYLIASRCGSPLYYLCSDRSNPQDTVFFSSETWLQYELIDFDPEKKLVTVSSEKLTDSTKWRVVPDNHILTINSAQEIEIIPWK